MLTDPEERLRQILRDRADSITTAPDYRTTPDAPDTRQRRPAPAPHPAARSWQLSTALLAAAVAVLATILLIPSHGGRHPPADKAGPCRPGRSPRFDAALRTGQLPNANEVLAGSPDGSQVVALTNGSSMASVTLVGPQGRVAHLWHAQPGEVRFALANPSSAVGSSVVSFALVPVDPGTNGISAWTRTILVVPRSGGAAVTLPPPDPGFGVSATGPLTAPVAGDGTVTVLEQSVARPADQRLVTYTAGPWRKTSSRRVADVIQLLDVGGQVIAVRRDTHGVDLSFTDPQYRPAPLEVAARHGSAFTTDGTTLTWFTTSAGRATVWSWRPGETYPAKQQLPGGFVPEAAGGGIVVGRFGRTLGHVTAMRPGQQLAELPADVSVLRIDGGFAVVHTLTGGFHRVPVSALVDC